MKPPGPPYDPNVPDKNGITPIHLAAENGHLEVMKLLIKKTNNPNSPEFKNGKTPLHLAAENGHVDIIKILIKYLLKPLDNECENPKQLAEKNGHKDIVKLFSSIKRTLNDQPEVESKKIKM